MNADAFEVEALLQRALAPVDPPSSLSVRVESTLQELTDLAVDELEGWELRAMGDPRNWVRPVAAVAVTATAGTALVLLRVRATSRRRAAPRNPAEAAARTLRSAAVEVRRLLRR